MENTDTRTKWQRFADAAERTWNWFDGKKTVIGTTAAIISQFIPEGHIAKKVLEGIVIVAGSSGVIHKVKKGELFNGIRRTSGPTN